MVSTSLLLARRDSSFQESSPRGNPMQLNGQSMKLLVLSVGLVVYTIWSFEKNFVDSPLYSEKEQAKVFLVHIGKTGGTTIGSLLKIRCDERRQPESRQWCYEDWKQLHNSSASSTFHNASSLLEESQLSQNTIGFLHVTEFFPSRSTLAEATHLLVPLRHPVERVVSWFYYLNPRNCHKVNGISTPRSQYTLRDKACVTDGRIESYPHSREAQFYRDCFPTVEEWGMAFSKTANEVKEGCHLLAQETLEGYGGPQAFAGHLWANYTYYAQATHYQYPNKIVLGVRTHRLWDDLVAIEQRLGGAGDVFLWQKEKEEIHKKQASNPTNAHNETKPYEKGELSPQAYFAMCCAVLEDFKVYQNLMLAAVNLEDAAQTMEEAYSQCDANIRCWNELKAACRNA